MLSPDFLLEQTRGREAAPFSTKQATSWRRCQGAQPVYDGIASGVHPSAALADMLDGGAGDADNRRYVLQALLVDTIGQT
jgi:hypothetical protein